MKKAGESLLGIGITMVVCCAVEIVNLHFQFYMLKLEIIGFFAGLALVIISLILIKAGKKSDYDYAPKSNYDIAEEQFNHSTRGLDKISRKHK
jgi:hypothetical protein